MSVEVIQEMKGNVKNKQKETKSCYESLKTLFNSHRMIMIIVFIAILLDNMLLTAIVPIVPKILSDGDKISKIIENETSGSECNDGVFNLRTSKINNTDFIRCFNQSNKTYHEMNHEEHSNEIGLMFAIKPIVQLICNPFIGPITNRIGYSIPMFTGLIIMFVSTMIFAFGNNYYLLLVARAVQGMGSACSSVSGMGMLATYYTDEKERGRAFAFALSGLALGVLIGPPYGGVTFQFISKEAPFLILAGLTLFDGILQLITLKPSVKRENQKGTSLLRLLMDPYILIATGAITFGNLGMAILEPTLPLWMKIKMNSEEWEQGVSFLSGSVSYLIGTNIFGPISHRIGRGNSAGIGLLICCFSLIGLPFSTKVEHLIAPMFGLGFAIGMIDSSMMPIMGYLVDLRHVAIYGSVYAIADVAFCVGFAAGPLLGTVLQRALGFKWMLWITAIISFVYAPLTIFLRKPPKRDDASDQVVVSESTNM
ncbi:unnamed protein product [Heterobilharzia americana]|nr:unnamed protein product [Heterobilharzia americana]